MLTDEETSTSNSILIKKYWHLDIDGSDNLTSYNRLIKFLEADQAKYLYMFIGTIVNGKRTDCDRGKVISECLLYFQNNGIQYRSKAQIRHRLSRLMKEFGEAHELSYTPEANIEGSDVNREMLALCPAYETLRPWIMNRYEDPCSIFAVAYKSNAYYNLKQEEEEEENNDKSNKALYQNKPLYKRQIIHNREKQPIDHHASIPYSSVSARSTPVPTVAELSTLPHSIARVETRPDIPRESSQPTDTYSVSETVPVRKNKRKAVDDLEVELDDPLSRNDRLIAKMKYDIAELKIKFMLQVIKEEGFSYSQKEKIIDEILFEVYTTDKYNTHKMK